MRFAIFVTLCLPPITAQAAFTDFSDFAQRQTFAEGVVFQSNGIAFKAHGWSDSLPFPLPNPVTVSVSQNYAALYTGPGVEFLLPMDTHEVSFSYVDGAGSGITVNGVEAAFPGRAGFSHLNGTAIADIDFVVTTSISTRTYEVGVITMRGPIHSLRLNGLETTIDNVTVRIPEPGAVALILTAIAVTVAARRQLQ